MVKYQLVLQWPASSNNDYDVMIEIENLLLRRLSRGTEIDGHDAGSGEVNIFIFTEDPANCFRELKTAIVRPGFWDVARVAYRKVNSDDYKILWPEGLSEFRIK